MTDDRPKTKTSREIYTVSRLNREAKLLLETALPPLWVEGEISNFARPASGHWYFTLKDSGAQVRCTMWKQATMRVRVTPRDGMQVLLRIRVSLYELRGEYQLQVEQLEEAGEGALRRRFDELKATLAAEGLFDAALKRALPTLPRRIGIITSPTGAAIRDILHILRRRFPAIPVIIYPVPVQGVGASAHIAAALACASRRQDADVLILARGGGSLEDLWSFNEEIVARAIRDCTIPVISGVGHEIDFTIADLAADVRAPTPSGAAELAVPDRAEWLRALLGVKQTLYRAIGQRLLTHGQGLQWLVGRLKRVHPRAQLRARGQRLDELEGSLSNLIRRHITERQQRLTWLAHRLDRVHPRHALATRRHHVSMLSPRLLRAVKLRLNVDQGRLAAAARTLQAVSPLATLERGYAIVQQPNGHIVRQASLLKPGEIVRIRTASGAFSAAVTDTDGTVA
jgi:exodeoxyribonuclease VII large subunit